MANWSNPTLTSLYTDFVTEVKNRDVDLALGLDPATTSPTNVPANAIRWNSASFKYQKWDGSTWNDLSAKYIFTAVEVSGSTVPVNGMYLSTTNTLNFSTASTASRLTIDGSGNVNIDSGTFYVDAVNNRVGVGTITPSWPLDIVKATDAIARCRANGNTSAGFLSSIDDGVNNWFFGSRSDSIGGSAGTERYNLLYGTNNLLTVSTSGNLGLGVVPSAWRTTVGTKVFQFGLAGALYAQDSSGTYWTSLTSNAFQNTSNQNAYINAGFATSYTQVLGQHIWSTAPSWNGTGSNAITFTQAMTLTAAGELLVGLTSGGKFSVSYNGNDTHFGLGANYDNYITAGSSGVTIFRNGTTERARIDSSGYMQGTVNGLGAGRIPAKQYYRLNTQYTGSNVNTAQPVFGVGVTLVGSTVYEFEALYLLAGVTTTSCAMSLLFGGTATVNNIMYKGAGFGQGGAFSTSDNGTGDGFYSRVASAAQVAVGLLSAVTVSYIIKGTVSINAGGTFIPQYIFSAVPGNAFITDIGSYFSIWPLGASGSNTSIGTWA